MRIYFYLSICLLLFLRANAQEPLYTKDTLAQMQWVDASYADMSLEEKIGQLFMVSIGSSESKVATDKVSTLIEENKIGGVIFLKGSPTKQLRLTNEYQSKSKTPLLIAMDAEWGLSMRLDSTYAFPWNMTLGAIQDSNHIEKVGFQIGKHAKRMGVHINFAPDIDINNNPRNPIIGNRSFGESPENVAQKGLAMMRGMQRAGILACGKHFPGHGDTDVDSHKALPVIDADRQRLDSIELYPFRKLIKNGLSSVMVAHLDVPCLESREGHPSSLSKSVISDVLIKELLFKGLVFTDALNMKAVSQFAKDGEVELEAFLAGSDVLLMPQDPKASINLFIEAYQAGKISERRLAVSVKKILMAKYKAGLQNYRPISEEQLLEDLMGNENEVIYEECMEQAITASKNKFSLLPIRNLENKRIAYVKFGDDDGSTFYETLTKYTNVTLVKAKNIAEYKKKLSQYNLVIIGFHKNNDSPWKGYKFTDTELFWLQEISKLRTSNTILSVFAKPYALSDVVNFNSIDAVLMAYQNSTIGQQKAAEAIFGAIEVKGKLPVSIGSTFKAGSGSELKSLKRLGYSVPEKVGMNSYGLKNVDSLMQIGLDSLMFPGAQVLIARKGKIFYNKTFGKPTYASDTTVNENHIYDLASLTKILATLPLIMKMEEEGHIALNDTFKELVPEYDDTELKDVTVLKALSHYGRLPAWIAFYVDTLSEDGKPSSQFYRNHPAEGFPYKVAENLYLTSAYKDSIYNRIGRQDLKSNRYRYSDVAYYVFKKYVEEFYGKTLDELANKYFYGPMGLDHTSFNPLKRFEKEEIVPSEEDTYYRHQTVQGYVHDMGAAMQGGVGGHAGLFSNATDVAKMMQMYLQGGTYGGTRFLNERTIKKFNTCYFCHKDVRRGVGFDKPQLKEKGPTCGCVSRKSFGHSGFTGTYTWADPEEELVYVFLSNRTFPSASNTLLIKSGLRTRIQQAIYDSIIN